MMNGSPEHFHLPDTIPPESTVVMRQKDFSIVRVEPSDHRESGDVEPIPGLESASLFARLGSPGDQQRFSDLKQIGEGGTAYVYALHDENCDREIAVKVLKGRDPSDYSEDVRRFITEGQTVAGLEHPSIIPIYDLNTDDTGRIYLCMRRIHGHTLLKYIENAAAAQEDKYIRSTNDLIQVILKVCDALSFAHSKGRVHQDLKPGNIMVGEFGQVFVIDWGSSSDDEISLTPVYMSPQQAKGLPPTPADDVYCLGATFYHCLFGRYPTDADTLPELIKKKRAGIVHEPNDLERGDTPRALTAIALKALATDPDGRYGSIDAFAADLKRYQEGRAVHAHQYTMFEFLAYWYRRHRHAVWSAILVFLVLAGAAGIIYNMKLKEMAGWGKPIVVERFDDDSWKQDWVIVQGEALVDNGRLESTSLGRFEMVFRKEFVGSHAIEFEGEVRADRAPGNLSIIWHDIVTWNADGTVKEMDGGTQLEAGSYGNSFSAIIREGSRLDLSLRRNKIGVRQTIRAEIDTHRLRLLIDGEEVCVVDEIFPHTSGYIGISSWHPGKLYDNIKIYRRGVPEKGPVTQIGDHDFVRGAYELAADAYYNVERSHGDKAIGQEAIFKRGLAMYRAGKQDAAWAVWHTLRDQSWIFRTELYKLREILEDNDYERVISRTYELHGKANEGQRKQLALFWDTAVTKLLRTKRFEMYDAFRDQHERLFPGNKLHHFLLGLILLRERRQDDVLAKYPEQRWLCSKALLDARRYADVLERYPEQHHTCAIALLEMKRYAELKERYPYEHGLIALSLHRAGKYREILEKYPNDRGRCANALLALGEYQKVFESYPDRMHAFRTAAFFLGKPEAVIERYSGDRHIYRQALIQMGTPQLFTDPNKIDLALFNMGHFNRILKELPLQRYICARVLLAQGRFDALRKTYPEQAIVVSKAAMYDGDFDRALQIAGAEEWQTGLILLMKGDYDEVKGRAPTHGQLHALADLAEGSPKAAKGRKAERVPIILAHIYEAIDHLASAQKAEATQKLSAFSEKQAGFWDEFLMTPYFLLRPALLQQLGDKQAADLALNRVVDKRKETFCQRLWYMAAYILGKIDEDEFRTQPYKLQMESRLTLAQALRSDRERKPSEARARYQKYAKYPSHQRELNPVVDHFVTWRVKVLGE